MNSPVYATPEHQIYLNVRYLLDKIHLTGSIQQIVNLENDASSVVNHVDYTLVKVKALYHLTGNFKFYVSGENLLNREYEVNRYYTMPGTTFFTGINFSF
jgi:iron complex outermembrane receptor protein